MQTACRFYFCHGYILFGRTILIYSIILFVLVRLSNIVELIYCGTNYVLMIGEFFMENHSSSYLINFTPQKYLPPITSNPLGSRVLSPLVRFPGSPSIFTIHLKKKFQGYQRHPKTPSIIYIVYLLSLFPLLLLCGFKCY
jgi:hypothetical protein